MIHLLHLLKFLPECPHFLSLSPSDEIAENNLNKQKLIFKQIITLLNAVN